MKVCSEPMSTHSSVHFVKPEQSFYCSVRRRRWGGGGRGRRGRTGRRSRRRGWRRRRWLRYSPRCSRTDARASPEPTGRRRTSSPAPSSASFLELCKNPRNSFLRLHSSKRWKPAKALGPTTTATTSGPS